MSLDSGRFLAGAKSRLLPPSIPFRFFLAAALFQVVFWAVLAAAAGELAGYSGGPGPVLAAAHLLTLGVFAMTAVGAALQLLPVATRRAIGAPRASRLAWWLLAPGAAALAFGFAGGGHGWMAAGGALAALALVIFAAMLARNLWGVTGMAAVTAHGWAAAACVVLLAGLGFALIADFEHGFFADRAAVAGVHLIVAVYGFMGLLAFGFSHVLVPMFALSRAPETAEGVTILAVALAAMAAAAVGLLVGEKAAVAAGAALGLAAAAGHVVSMARVLKGRLRRRLGVSFVLIRAGWGLLVAGPALGLALALEVPVPGGVALFGVVALIGWLLTFLLGVLQRILPFLASMHTTKGGGPPALVSELTPERWLKVHAVLHLAGVAGVALGVAMGAAAPIVAGALAGLAGAVLFAAFAVRVVVRMARHGRRAATRPLIDPPPRAPGPGGPG